VSDLDRAVRAVIRDCLAVKDGEEVVVVCNPATQNMGEMLRNEAADVGVERIYVDLHRTFGPELDDPDRRLAYYMDAWKRALGEAGD
jgi:hypothetical protein